VQVLIIVQWRIINSHSLIRKSRTERMFLLRDLKFLLDIDLKIILLNHQNNFVEALKIMNIAAKI